MPLDSICPAVYWGSLLAFWRKEEALADEIEASGADDTSEEVEGGDNEDE